MNEITEIEDKSLDDILLEARNIIDGKFELQEKLDAREWRFKHILIGILLSVGFNLLGEFYRPLFWVSAGIGFACAVIVWSGYLD